ncbi:MAG: ABC transporter substrate-binding protein, partial [Candidatus Taylorbacteria bacterium]|nr:ABC transporter substrate-binding protein [Candidatus Taylorbacteria bacterium]
PKTGGEFREGIVGQPIFINPVVPVSQADRDLSRLVFSSAEDIAESVKISEDNRTYNLRIKEGILWQDGEKLTTDDIVFTVQTIQNPAANSTLLTSFQGVSVERVSELEIKFILQIPYAFFEQDNLKNLFIIPKHIFADTPVENLKLSAFGLEPIGSGPYKVSSYKKDEKGVITLMNLAENENYFGDKPYISKITFKFYRNTAELLKGFNSGEIDGFGLSTAESLGDIKLRHNVSYLPSLRYYAVFINQSSSNKNLMDLKTRRALAEVVDRKKMTEEIFASHASLLYGPTTLTDIPDYTIDTTLLKDIQLNVTVPEEPFLVKTAEALKSTWESYGAKVNLRILSLKNILEDVSRTIDYELLLFGNTVSVEKDLFAFWHSSRRSYPEQNLSLYQNKNVDRELEA